MSEETLPTNDQPQGAPVPPTGVEASSATPSTLAEEPQESVPAMATEEAKPQAAEYAVADPDATAPAVAPHPQPNTQAAKPAEKSAPAPKRNQSPIASRLALVMGIIFIVVGITRLADVDHAVYSTSFGADFYTYTYRGIVSIDESLKAIERVLDILVAAFGTLLTYLGCRDFSK